MKTSNTKITGILLTGGMSSRMGREKGSLRLGGRMMYEYPLSALEALCDEILISGPKALPGNYPYPIIKDEIKGIGPMAGIHAGLGHSSNDLNLVISYDLPLINAELLSFLVKNSEDCDLVAPAIQADKPEPLCAIYRKSLMSVIETLIEEERYAVHLVISRARSRIMNIHKDLPFYHPDLFLNINRAADLKRLPESFGTEA